MKIRGLLLGGLILIGIGLVSIVWLLRGGAIAPAPADERDPAGDRRPPAAEVVRFLTEYNAAYLPLWTAAETARWRAAVEIGEPTSRAAALANQALADYTGSRQIIDRLQYLRRAAGLEETLDRQLELAWELAAHHPGTVPATVRKLIQAEARQSAALHGRSYRLAVPGREARDVSLAELDRLLLESRDPAVRRAAWEGGGAAGPALKDGLAELQELRNAVARAMGYSSYFALACADYGLTGREMLRLLDDLREGLLPLYEQLHCWVRHELAARYGQQPAPRLIPAHWLPERWGRAWPGVVPGVDLDGLVRGVSAPWLAEQAERFWAGLGLGPLPVTYWSRSDLYELGEGAGRRKSGETATLHLDLAQDVRTLANLRGDFGSLRAAHREIGRAHYRLAYARPEVPPLLRRSANRAFDGAIGLLGELAGTQVPYLREIGLLAADQAPDRIRWLLSQALTGPVVLVPFACGALAHWEHDFYEQDLPRHLYNDRWWRYAAAMQGIAPPSPRGEDLCDPALLVSIVEQPARSYDLALSHVIAHQLHRSICRHVLEQDVHEASYHGEPRVGVYLAPLLAAGATRDANRLLLDATGETLSPSALLDYYEPLLAWLREQNAGRTASWR